MMYKHVVHWTSVVLWMAMIYFFSNQPNLQSGFEPTIDLILRKIAHVAEYFVLTYLIFRALLGHTIRWPQALFLAAIIAIGYAGSDEWHQQFISGRRGSPLDVGVDSLGVLAASVLLMFQRLK